MSFRNLETMCRSWASPRRAGLAVVTAFAMIAIHAGTALALEPAFCDRDNESHGACYGLEPTFTKKALQEEERGGPAAQAAADAWRAKVIEKCKDRMTYSCRIEKIGGDSMAMADKCRASKETASETIDKGEKFRVCVYPGGKSTSTKPWWYELTFDYSVIELKTRPANAAWLTVLSTNEGIIDRLMFETARETGLAPHPKWGGGHIHIDVTSGFASPVHLVNFMTRIHNLRMLPLNPDLEDMGLNSPPLAMLGAAARARYSTFIQGDLGKYNATGGLVKLTEDLAAAVYLDTYSDRLMGPRDAAPIKQRYAELSQRYAMERGHPLPEYDDKAWGFPPDYQKLPPEVRDALLAADSVRLTHYRAEDDQDIGFGWAHKSQHIRMAPQYGTIEIRNLAAPMSVADINNLIWLMSSAIDTTPKDRKLALDTDLALAGTDADLPKAWRNDEHQYGVKRFKLDATLAQEEVTDIVKRFRAFVDNDKLVCRLIGLMPAQIQHQLEPTCAPAKKD